MKKIYFTRHGQSFWNVENKICGATDIALTEKGHEQAAELAKNIAAAILLPLPLQNQQSPNKQASLHNQGTPLLQRIKIDEILYSPLSRAAETASQRSSECARSLCGLEI